MNEPHKTADIDDDEALKARLKAMLRLAQAEFGVSHLLLQLTTYQALIEMGNVPTSSSEDGIFIYDKPRHKGGGPSSKKRR